MCLSQIHTVGGCDEVEAPDFAAAVGAYGDAVGASQIKDAQASGETAAPGEVGLPEAEGAGTCEVGEAVVGEVVLAAGKEDGGELWAQGSEFVQMVGGEDIFKPVDPVIS